MFTLTPAAAEMLRTYFVDKELRPMRIFLKEKMCGGPRVIVGIDTQLDTDMVFTRDGFTFVIDRTFYEQVAPVTVDFSDNQFRVRCALAPNAACDSCCQAGTCAD